MADDYGHYLPEDMLERGEDDLGVVTRKPYSRLFKSGLIEELVHTPDKTLLTQGQLDRHRNERRPRGSHVLSCGFLLQINGSFYAKFRPNSMDSCIEIGSKRRWPSS